MLLELLLEHLPAQYKCLEFYDVFKKVRGKRLAILEVNRVHQTMQ